MPMDELAKRAKELTDEEIQGEIAVAQEEGAGDVAEVLQAELQSRKGDEGEMEDDDKAKMCGDRKKMEGEGEGEGEMEDDEMKAGMGVDDFDLNSAPPSARFLSGTHRGLAKLSQMLAGAKMQVENPDVLAYTDEMDEMLKNMMSQSESLFSGVTEGKAMTYGDDTEDDDEMNHFKSWVMGQASRPLQVHGIAAQLKTICAKDALDDKDKARLTGIAAQLDRIGEVGRAERRKTLEAEARRAKEREEADKQNKLQPADTSFLNEWKQDVEAARKKAADLGMV